MSYIVDFMKREYLKHIDTTKDLVYKKNEIDVHDIKGSYEELVKNGSYTEIRGLSFNGSPLFTNPSHTSEQMNRMYSMYMFTTMAIQKSALPDIDWITTEIQNSLWIEGVMSSRKKIKQIVKEGVEKDPDHSSKVILNYNEAIRFIMTTENINETNVHTLYSLLSKDIDMGKNRLDGYPYRNDPVEIGSPEVTGIDSSLIKKHMDEMFLLINEKIDLHHEQDKQFLPMIIHYLFEIIHPYYDMNGRMGRLLAMWVGRKMGNLNNVKFLSESINRFKEELYYKAFKDSSFKGFKNDITYFTASVMAAIVANNVVIAVASSIKMKIERENGIVLSVRDIDIVRSLLAKDVDKMYTTPEFILGIEEINPSLISKSLQKLVGLKILKEVNSKPKKYSINWTPKIKNQIKEFAGFGMENETQF